MRKKDLQGKSSKAMSYNHRFGPISKAISIIYDADGGARSTPVWAEEGGDSRFGTLSLYHGTTFHHGDTEPQRESSREKALLFLRVSVWVVSFYFLRPLPPRGRWSISRQTYLRRSLFYGTGSGLADVLLAGMLCELSLELFQHRISRVSRLWFDDENPDARQGRTHFLVG